MNSASNGAMEMKFGLLMTCMMMDRTIFSVEISLTFAMQGNIFLEMVAFDIVY